MNPTSERQRQKERYKRNIKKVSVMAYEQVKELGKNLPEMDYFLNILRYNFVDFKQINNTKTIGSYCAMVPEEIIYALGYLPLRLCGSHSIAAIMGDELAPRDACPVIKASLGFESLKIVPVYENCKAVIVPLTCDGKKKSVELLANYVPTVPLPLDIAKNNYDFENLVKTFYSLTETLEFMTRKKISASKLKRSCVNVNEASKQVYTLYNFLQMKYPPISGTEVMIILNSYCYDDVNNWTKKLKELNKKLEKISKQKPLRKNPKPRIIVTGSPIGFPNIKIPYLIESLGAQIVSDESCLAGRMLYDLVVPTDYSKDSIIRALAARYVAPCTCPVFSTLEDRLCSLEQRVKNTNADGIIYYVLRGCIPNDFEVSYVENWAEKMNIPVLRVETDFNTEDYEQLKIRVEAFIEMLENNF